MDATTTKKTHATVAGESRFSSASASPSPSFSVFPSRAARARFVLALSPWRLRMIADPVIPPFLTRSAAARFASSSRRACSLTADLALSDCASGGGERERGERVRDAWRQAGGVIEAGGRGGHRSSRSLSASMRGRAARHTDALRAGRRACSAQRLRPQLAREARYTGAPRRACSARHSRLIGREENAKLRALLQGPRTILCAAN